MLISFSAFGKVFLVAGVGLLVSVAVDQLVKPRALLMRGLSIWAIHVGLWVAVYGLLLLTFGRPWFSGALVTALFLTLVLVNNAKFKALREPFVFQDFEYFTDAVRHPRLYIPYLGWPRFCFATFGFFVAVMVGLLLEPAPHDRWLLQGQLGALLVLVGLAILLLYGCKNAITALSFNPGCEVPRFGLLASLWAYGWAYRDWPCISSPFDTLPRPSSDTVLPDLIAVQSESFFDPRSLYAGIRSDVLSNFDHVLKQASMSGSLNVPAWGANTIRSEFAFLTSLGEWQLGVHRFNPYSLLAAGWSVASLVSYLKTVGYRTICIHPYPASFYLRDRVMPVLGFDEFLDIQDFVGAERVGPFVSDAVVTDKILNVLDGHAGPNFIFVITMENHGPLHLEKLAEPDVAALYNEPPKAIYDDLTVYLRHLRNADQMIGRLCACLGKRAAAGGRPGSLCWYGDHVPIMPGVYKALGYPEQDTSYLIWDSRSSYRQGQVANRSVHELALDWVSCCLNKYD